MKMSEHVETLLRQGKKPRELLELGFPKQVITRMNRRLKKERAAQHQRVPKAKGRAKSLPEPVVVSPEPISPVDQGLASLKNDINELRGRIETLETTSRSLVEENLSTQKRAEFSAGKAEVTCLYCQTAFPRDNVFSICRDCVVRLEAGVVDELIDAYFGL